MREKKLVPKRRFKKFNEGWKALSFDEVLNVNSGRDYKHLNVGNIPVYGTGGLMLHVDDKLSEEDSIGIGRKGTIDKPQLLKAPFWTVDTLFFMTPHNNTNLYFLFSKSQTIDWRKMDESTGVPSLSKKTIEKIQINMTCLKEQQKIGEFFKHLDQMITLEQRKLEKTKAMKSAYLAEMFPAEGERVPKRRFSGFMGEWEYRKFDEEIDLYSGLTYSPKDIKEKGTFVLRSSNVKNGEVVDADNVYVDSEVVNSSNVRKGDIIVVVRNGSRSLIGKHAQIKVEMCGTVIGAFMTGIRSRQPRFINALLDTKEFKKEVDKNLGATINQITNGMFRNMIFLFPEIQEQEAIGEFFNKLDDTITNQQQKLKKLKAMKQAYLQEMFV